MSQSNVVRRLEAAGFSRSGAPGIGNSYQSPSGLVRLAPESVHLARPGTINSSAYVHHVVNSDDAVLIVTGQQGLVAEFQGLVEPTGYDPKGYPLWRGDSLEQLLVALGV